MSYDFAKPPGKATRFLLVRYRDIQVGLDLFPSLRALQRAAGMGTVGGFCAWNVGMRSVILGLHKNTKFFVLGHEAWHAVQAMKSILRLKKAWTRRSAQWKEECLADMNGAIIMSVRSVMAREREKERA